MAETNNSHTPLPDAAIETLWRKAAELEAGMVSFARRMVQSPSLPGQEREVANIVAEEMRSLGYDDVRIDQTGNVIGLIRATAPGNGGAAHSVMFNTHMDQVDVGDESRWPHPPFAAEVIGDEIWGRGTSDLKGSLACQVYTGALLKASGLPLPNDVYVTGVVQEEIGGHGAAMLASELQTDYVVVGEPSHNRLALGHRGRFEIHVTITGKSVHASVPQTGVNPLYSMARFLLSLEKLTFEPDPLHLALGPTSVAPTLLTTDQVSANVVPGQCKLVIDIRNTPGDRPEAIRERITGLLEGALAGGATGTVTIPPTPMKSYTGLERTYEIPAVPFGIAENDPLVQRANMLLDQALRRPVETQLWQFATDAGHFAAHGMQVIGFGPGYEEVIHTVNERISIPLMTEGMVGNAALALGL
ncbi:MAG: M20/M25/M40 family metallo-hydrolase [Chloroflexota bacterium]